jgi:hypothetical protein
MSDDEKDEDEKQRRLLRWFTYAAFTFLLAVAGIKQNATGPRMGKRK